MEQTNPANQISTEGLVEVPLGRPKNQKNPFFEDPSQKTQRAISELQEAKQGFPQEMYEVGNSPCCN